MVSLGAKGYCWPKLVCETSKSNLQGPRSVFSGICLHPPPGLLGSMPIWRYVSRNFDSVNQVWSLGNCFNLKWDRVHLFSHNPSLFGHCLCPRLDLPKCKYIISAELEMTLEEVISPRNRQTNKSKKRSW